MDEGKINGKSSSAAHQLTGLPRIGSAGSTLYDTLLTLSGGKELLRIDEISELLHVDYKIVYHAVRGNKLAPGGKLLSYRFGGIYLIRTADLADYMTKHSNLPESQSPLEMLMESLNPLDPGDWQFKQVMDDYLLDKAAQACKEHSLKMPYAFAYVSAQVAALLCGDDAAATATGKLPRQIVKSDAKPQGSETA